MRLAAVCLSLVLVAGAGAGCAELNLEPAQTTASVLASVSATASASASATASASASASVSADTLAKSEPVEGDSSDESNDISSPALRRAEAALDSLVVKGRAPKTGYDREAFGQTWADVDRNGCDTRNDILRRDLDVVTFKPKTHDCVVLTGELDDPYTGKEISFKRGEDTSADVQIDHVVALSNAWQTGAQGLDEDERKKLANDPLELIAVDGRTNQSKGDGDTATWLPPNKPYRCLYVARQISVKAKYELWVTKAEKAAMERILSKC